MPGGSAGDGSSAREQVGEYGGAGKILRGGNGFPEHLKFQLPLSEAVERSFSFGTGLRRKAPETAMGRFLL